MVIATFADERVARIEPLDGRARPVPGAAYLTAPSACDAGAGSS
jgi:hypothetical protein